MINVKSILDDLKCSICLDFFVDPRTLSCQHSFCLKCIKPVAKVSPVTRGVLFVDCPQCRKTFTFENFDSVPKNLLLSNLINTVNVSTKAACPSCKATDDLTVCDHCSGIFCSKCYEIHFKNLLDQFSNRIKTIDTISENFLNCKSMIATDEQNTFKDVVKRMESVQAKIFSLWQSRKIHFINDIRQFYKAKSDEMEVAEFRWKILAKELSDITDKKKELEAKTNHQLRSNETVKYFVDLEKELDSLEKKFEESFSNLNINSNRLKVTYNEIDTMAVFSKLIQSIKLESESQADERFLDVKKKFNIELKDLFGKTVCVIMDGSLTMTIEQLKEKAKFLTGVKSKQIKLMDKKEAVELENKIEILFENGKCYSRPNKDEKLNEIDLYLSYIYD